MQTTARLAVGLVLLSIPAAALAEVTVTSPHRQLLTFSSVVVDQVFDVDSDVFNADSTGQVELQDVGDAAIGASTAHAEAWHSSFINGSTISVMGATGATAAVDPTVPNAFAEANGATNLSLYLEIDIPTEYVLSGGLGHGGAGHVELRLTSQSEGTVWSFSPPPDGTLPLSEVGVLQPDTYVLTFGSGGYAQAGPGAGVDVQTGTFDIVIDLLDVVAVAEGTPVAGGRLEVVPNPMRAGTPLHLDVGDAPKDVTISILDVSGRLLSRLTPEGGRTSWDGTDAHGRPAAPGVYFVRLDGTRTTSRVTVLR